MSDDQDKPEDQQMVVERRCLEAALEAASSPLYANRFEVIPVSEAPDGQVILTFGGLIAGERSDSHSHSELFAYVTIHGAYLINRGFAADIVAKLEKMLSPEEISAARRKLSGGANG